MKKISDIQPLLPFVGVILVFTFLILLIPSSRIVSQDSKTITVSKQSLYQRWFTGKEEILTYPQDRYYNGEIVSAESGTHYVGVVGKGGHLTRHYDVIIKYNNGKQITFRVSEKDYETLQSMDIIIHEQFYPWHEVSLKH